MGGEGDWEMGGGGVEGVFREVRGRMEGDWCEEGGEVEKGRVVGEGERREGI